MVALLAAAAVAVALQVTSMQDDGQVLVGDEARTAVESLDALRTAPRLGVPTTSSEFIDRSLSNPGPALLYAMHPFVRALGTDVGAWTFAALVGVASVALAAWAATRRGGSATGLVVVLVAIAMARRTNPGGLTHSLNTEVVLLPTFSCFALAWAVAAGDTVMLPVLALLATFVVQTFVGISPLIALPCAVAVAFVAGRALRGERPRHLGLHVASTVGVLALAWFLPLYDEVRATGNLSGLLGFRTAGRGLADAAGTLQAVLDPFGAGIGVEAIDPRGRGWLLGVAAIVALAATRRGRAAAWRHRHLVAITASVVVASAAITWVDPPSDTATYHFFHVGLARYQLLLCLLVVGASAVAEPLARATDRRTPIGAARLAPIGTAALLALLVVTGWRHVRALPTSDQRRLEMRAVVELADAVAPAGGHADQVQVVSRGGSSYGNVAQGIVARLRSDGLAVTSGFHPLAPDDRLLVVADPGIGEVVGADVLATTERGGSSFDPAALRTWARADGPLVLSPSGIDNLTDRLDGAEPEICPEAAAADPDLLTALSPDAFARVFAGGEITSPEPAPEVRAELADWTAQRGFALLEVETDAQLRRSFAYGQPFLSALDCPG